MLALTYRSTNKGMSNAAPRLACCWPHCRFDGDICTTVPAPLAAETRPCCKQHLAYQSITHCFARCGKPQTVEFYSTRE